MKGKKNRRLTGAICCALATLAISAHAQQVSTKLDLPYVSKYVWRGTVPNSDPAFQPSLTLTHSSGVSFNLWASLDATDVNKEKDHATEIDYTLNKAWSAGKIAMNAGLIDYTFPNTPFPTTSEVYASAGLGGKYSPTLSINYDFDEANGFYASLGAGYSCSISRNKSASKPVNFSARLSYASANYNKFYFSAPESAFTDLLLTAGIPFSAGKSWSVTPAINYSTVLDGALRDGVKDPDNFFTTLTASYEF